MRARESQGCEDPRGLAGRVLVLLRGYRGLSQKELARRTGLHHATVSQYERGRRSIDEEARRRILEALDLPGRAWEAVEGVVEWLDWLSEQRAGLPGVEGPVGGAGAEASYEARAGALRHEANLLADEAGRQRQREVAGLLRFLLALSS